MFARAGRIVDVFIPIDKVFGLNWGLDLFGLHPRDRQIKLWTWQMGDLGVGEEFVPK